LPTAPATQRGISPQIDARVLAELSLRDLVPAIWLPTPELRREREISRWRLHLVRHRSTLKNRVHSTLIAFGHQVPMADLFGVAGRRLLGELDIPQPWRGHVDASLELINDLDRRIGAVEKELARSGADHRYVPLLMTAPGFGWITSFTVACEIGDITRFSSPVKLTGYTGLCPRVKQSGDMDQRGPLSTHGPRYLRWGLMEAAIHAATEPRIELLLDRPLDDQPGPEPSEFGQHPRWIVDQPARQQLVDVRLYLRRWRYRASHGVGLPSSSGRT